MGSESKEEKQRRKTEKKKKELLGRLDTWAAIATLAGFGVLILVIIFQSLTAPSSYSRELREENSIVIGSFYPREILLDKKKRRVVLRMDPLLKPLTGFVIPGFFIILFLSQLAFFVVAALKGKKPWSGFKTVLRLIALLGLCIFFLEKMTYKKEIVLDGRARTVSIKAGRVAGLGGESLKTIPYSKVKGLRLKVNSRKYDFTLRLKFRGSPSAHKSIRVFYFDQGPKNWIRRKRDMGRVRGILARTAGL